MVITLPKTMPRRRRTLTRPKQRFSGFYHSRRSCALGGDVKSRCRGETVHIEGTPYYLCTGVHLPRYEMIVTAEMLRRQAPASEPLSVFELVLPPRIPHAA